MQQLQPAAANEKRPANLDQAALRAVIAVADVAAMPLVPPSPPQQQLSSPPLPPPPPCEQQCKKAQLQKNGEMNSLQVQLSSDGAEILKMENKASKKMHQPPPPPT